MGLLGRESMEAKGLSQFICDYIENRKRPKLEAYDKEVQKKLSGLSLPEEIEFERQQIAEQRFELEQHYKVRNWLTDAAVRAGQINLVTHALKFTHSDAKGSSVYLSSHSANAYPVLSSGMLHKLVIDAVGNAAALDVAKLLQTEVQGDSLVACFRRGDYSALAELAANHSQLQLWVSGFKQAFSDNQPSSHKFAKQLYFPISGSEYHLISPLYASSLAQALYQRIIMARFSEESAVIRKARREQTWCANRYVAFTNLAVQGIGGTKPQNISYLNSVRGGKSYLLRCAPPDLPLKLEPPIKQETIFGLVYTRLAAVSLKRLHWSLLNAEEKDRAIYPYQGWEERIDELIGILFNYVAEIQNLAAYQGWSANKECRLKRSQQLWLDPLRQNVDQEFFDERKQGGWQYEIADSFAHWVNVQLKKSGELEMSDVEFRASSALLHRRLREFDEYMLEVLP